MNRAQKIKDIGYLLAETYRAMMADGDDAWLERLTRGQAPYSPLFNWLSKHDADDLGSQGTGTIGLLTELLIAGDLADRDAASPVRRRAALVQDLGYELASDLDVARQDCDLSNAVTTLYRLSDPWASEVEWCVLIGRLNEAEEEAWAREDVDALLRTHPRALLREVVRSMGRSVWGEYAAIYDELLTKPGFWWADGGTAVWLGDEDDSEYTLDGDAGPLLEAPCGRAVPWGTYLFDGGTDLKPVVIG